MVTRNFWEGMTRVTNQPINSISKKIFEYMATLIILSSTADDTITINSICSSTVNIEWYTPHATNKTPDSRVLSWWRAAHARYQIKSFSDILLLMKLSLLHKDDSNPWKWRFWWLLKGTSIERLLEADGEGRYLLLLFKHLLLL